MYLVRVSIDNVIYEFATLDAKSAWMLYWLFHARACKSKYCNDPWIVISSTMGFHDPKEGADLPLITDGADVHISLL